MSIIDVEARLYCDGCGTPFSIMLDTASNTKVYDEIINGLLTSNDRGRIGDRGTVSYQQGLMLCPSCTKIADAIDEETHLPTKQEIEAAISKTLEVHANENGR